MRKIDYQLQKFFKKNKYVPGVFKKRMAFFPTNPQRSEKQNAILFLKNVLFLGVFSFLSGIHPIFAVPIVIWIVCFFGKNFINDLDLIRK